MNAFHYDSAYRVNSIVISVNPMATSEGMLYPEATAKMIGKLAERAKRIATPRVAQQPQEAPSAGFMHRLRRFFGAGK